MPGGSYQPVTLQPSSGGDLITRASIENVGGSNYVTKRDWRRIMDGEVRREGHQNFVPNPEADPDDQTIVSEGNPIILIHFSRKPNGETAVIVGTQTSLFRYFSFDDGGVFTIDVFTSDVFEDLSGQWLEIGHGFSSNGNRWEAVEVAGKTVFNNGVDLPVVYDLGWLQVKPLIEFREQGFAFAGTIAEFNGMLVLADVAEITPENLLTVMQGRFVGSVSQSGHTITAGAAAFSADDIGKTVIWTGGQQAKITGYSSTTVVTSDSFQTVASNSTKIALLFGTVTDSALYSRVQYKMVFSNVGNAEDFASGADVQATAGGTVITTPFPFFSINIGDEVILPGAGEDGAALITTVTGLTNGLHEQFILADTESTDVDSSFFQRTARLNSLSQAVELQDDGSPIVRMIELQGRLVVFKDNGIFIGTFTGIAGDLMSFQKVYAGSNSIGWKWLLTKVNGASLVYAGSNGFYEFDLASLMPKPQGKLFLCQDIFFNLDDELADYNDYWAATNDITNEVWFMFPNDGEDQGLLYDYRYDTCSTIGVSYTSGGSIYKPLDGDVQIGVGESWFIMGTSDGKVYQYGLTDLAPGIWTRGGANYVSTLLSGLTGVTDQFNESDLRNYVAYFGAFPGTPVTVTLYGTRNAHEPTTQLFAREIASPTYKNLIPTYFRKNYYQDKIEVLDSDTNAKIVRRVLEFLPIDSRSTIRNNST